MQMVIIFAHVYSKNAGRCGAILLFNIIALPIDSFDQCNLNFNVIGHTFAVDSFPFTRL